MADFRYTMKNGEEVEAFQMTEDTRYQEKNWPEWMNSRYLMTIEGVEWLNINDVETEIPSFGWIVRYPGGSIGAVDYSVMESAAKVVVDEGPERDEPSEVNEDQLVELAAKLAGLTVEEFKAAQAKKNKSKPKPVTPLALAPTPMVDAHADRIVADDFLAEVSEAYGKLKSSHIDEGIKLLQKTLASRVEWCNCPPGLCEGGEFIGCRRNSPLAK